MGSLTLSSLLKSSSYWSRQAIIRWQLVIFLVVGWGLIRWFRVEYGQDDSNLWLVMNVFILLAQWSVIGLISISILSALVTWLYFRYSISKHAVTIQTKFGDGQKAEAGWVPLQITLVGTVFRPLLGTLQASLVFSDNRLSNRIILDSNVRKARVLWRIGVQGVGVTMLHDRGIYDVEKVQVVYCDMLGLVALPCTIPFTRQLYTLPLPMPERKVKAQPHSAEEQKHRIEIPRRVEGEYVNYKEFETGDNIQRIVWKIYAKSGQLVVRVPETKDPYASHLYLYASFFHGFNPERGAFETELLNVYKDRLRNLFEALQRNGYDVRIPADQEIPKLAGVSEKKSELFQITAGSWQNSMPPMLFVKPAKAAFICVSSLTPANELQNLLQRVPDLVPIVVVKLSNAIPSPFQLSVKDVFFRPEKKPADALQRPWLLSSLRRALIRNEHEIGQLISKRNNSWMTDVIEF